MAPGSCLNNGRDPCGLQTVPLIASRRRRIGAPLPRSGQFWRDWRCCKGWRRRSLQNQEPWIFRPVLVEEETTFHPQVQGSFSERSPAPSNAQHLVTKELYPPSSSALGLIGLVLCAAFRSFEGCQASLKATLGSSEWFRYLPLFIVASTATPPMRCDLRSPGQVQVVHARCQHAVDDLCKRLHVSPLRTDDPDDPLAS